MKPHDTALVPLHHSQHSILPWAIGQLPIDFLARNATLPRVLHLAVVRNEEFEGAFDVVHPSHPNRLCNSRVVASGFWAPFFPSRQEE